MPLDLGDRCRDVVHITFSTEKYIVSYVHSIRGSPVSNWRRPPVEELRALAHESLYSRLIGHSSCKRTVNRSSFGPHQIQELTEGNAATMMRLVTHCEHVHPVRTNVRVNR